MVSVPFEKAVYLPGSSQRIGVLLLHSYTGTTRDMNLLGRLMQRQGYSVMVPLYSGHDTADIKSVLDYSPMIWRQEAHEAYYWMAKQDFDYFFVFGLSLGGILATDIMAQADFKGCGGGIFNAPVKTQEPIDISASFMHLGQFLAERRNDQAAFREEFDDILEGHWHQMRELEALKADIEPRLSLIDKPFYIAQSGEDELIDPEDAYHLQDSLVNAQISYHYFPHNTHSITTNRDRKAFDQSVLDFIDRVVNP